MWSYAGAYHNGVGADTLIGGLGDDYYVVTDSSTVIVELAGEGGEIGDCATEVPGGSADLLAAALFLDPLDGGAGRAAVMTLPGSLTRQLCRPPLWTIGGARPATTQYKKERDEMTKVSKVRSVELLACDAGWRKPR